MGEQEVRLILVRGELVEPRDVSVQRHRRVRLQLARHLPLVPLNPRLRQAHVVPNVARQARRPRQQRRVVRRAQLGVAGVPGQGPLERGIDGVEHVQVAQVDRLREATANELEHDGGLLDLLVHLGGRVAEPGRERERRAVGWERDGRVVVLERAGGVEGVGGRGHARSFG